MIDIIRFEEEALNLGFSKLIHVSEIKTIEGRDFERNLKSIKRKNLDIIYSCEKYAKKDFLNFRNSGLNHIICKALKEREVAVGFNFNDILNSSNEERSLIIGRMMQNVRLCRKYKIEMVIASFAKNKFEMRSAKDLLAFVRVIGMNGQEAKKALNFKKKEMKIDVLNE